MNKRHGTFSDEVKDLCGNMRGENNAIRAFDFPS